MSASADDRSLDFVNVFHKIYFIAFDDSSGLRSRPSFLLTGWFMTYQLDVAFGHDIVARWCALAEQRLEYLTQLFETGRWRRFHTELAFLENIREAKIAVEIWRDLSSREASRDNRAIDMSWLGHTIPTALPRAESWNYQFELPEPAESSAAQLPEKPIALQPGPVDAEQVLAARESGEDASELPPRIGAFAARYPLLYNAL